MKSLLEISNNLRDNIDQQKTFREILFILLFNIIDKHHFGPKKCSSPKYSDLVNFIILMTQISSRLIGLLDCVENLTRQRHDGDQTENQQNAAIVVGSRQHGVAQQKVEQPTRVEWSVPNARGSDIGWAQIQTSIHVIARDYEQ